MPENSVRTWCHGRGGSSCGDHTSSFCFPGEARELRSPLEVVRVIMVPLEKDVNIYGWKVLLVPKPSFQALCSQVKTDRKTGVWSWGQARQGRGSQRRSMREWVQMLSGRAWEGKSSAEPILSSGFHTEGSEAMWYLFSKSNYAPGSVLSSRVTWP